MVSLNIFQFENPNSIEDNEKKHVHWRRQSFACTYISILWNASINNRSIVTTCDVPLFNMVCLSFFHLDLSVIVYHLQVAQVNSACLGARTETHIVNINNNNCCHTHSHTHREHWFALYISIWPLYNPTDQRASKQEILARYKIHSPIWFPPLLHFRLSFHWIFDSQNKRN